MPYVFSLNQESLRRKFAVYVVVAKGTHDIKLYVGKTGDNRSGCNPLISRCGNHFSYNQVHSQVRNKLADHEHRHYTYIFDHFDDYPDDETQRRKCIDRINEMERWLAEEVQKIAISKQNLALLNPYRAAAHVSVAEKGKRAAFRTKDCKAKIAALISEVKRHVR